MTQQKPAQTQAQAAASKRVIHLKRPSTNFQVSHSNQPSLISKNNPFTQRAASRVEQIDRQHELAFQSNGNQATTSGSSTFTTMQRPSAQIRISKKQTNGVAKTNNLV